MRNLFLISTLLLAGCAGNFSSNLEPPTVDMRGVDAQKYAHDLAECTEQKRQSGFGTPGGAISRCLTARGYVVTIART